MEVKTIKFNGVELITTKELVRICKSNRITISKYLKLFNIPYIEISKQKLYDFECAKSIYEFIEQKKNN